MVALVVSTIITIIMCLMVVGYAKRRPIENEMTWGEAAVFSAFIFFIMFFAWGIVPHQWLTLAENEWSFREDRLWDAWGLITPQSQGGWFPFDITYRTLSDTIGSLIYIISLGPMIILWRNWQTRGESAAAAELAVRKSTYGRPLVRKG